jgi:hypothetical protein
MLAQNAIAETGTEGPAAFNLHLDAFAYFSPRPRRESGIGYGACLHFALPFPDH